MDNIDLNEDNYDYNKLLELFSLDRDFNHVDLKKAKLKVLRLHPDKTKLPVKYYLFFRKMYYKIEEIYSYMNHETSEENLKKSIDIDTHFKEYLERKNIDPIHNFKVFTREFNKMFESVYISDNNIGYDNWLKSDENMYDKDNLEKSRKKAIQENQLIEKNEIIEEVGLFTSSNNFGHDIKECHENPFIALDINDIYNKKQKFKSVQEYQQFMAKEDHKNKPYNFDQSIDYLKKKEDLLNNQSKEIAYQNLKKKEETNKKYNNYVSTFLKLNN